MNDDQSHLARNVFALSLMTFCYAAFQGICQTIVPLAMDHQEFTKTTIGLMQAVPGIIVIGLGGSAYRTLIDTQGRRQHSISGETNAWNTTIVRISSN